MNHHQDSFQFSPSNSHLITGYDENTKRIFAEQPLDGGHISTTQRIPNVSLITFGTGKTKRKNQFLDHLHC